MTRTSSLLLILLATALSAGASAVEIRLTDTAGQPVPDAVVSLVAVDQPIPAAAVSTDTPPVEITQRHQEFLPFVTAVRVGSPVRFPNRDTVQHHVYSLSKPKKFELPLYDPGKAETVVFDRPGVVTVGCNIHDWMLAYIVVLETPWFAVTPADGVATFPTLSPGRYRLEIWHPRLAAAVSRDLLVAETPPPSVPLPLTLKPDRRIRRAPDTGPAGYR